MTEDSALPDRYYTAEHGLCLFIETEGKNILFDAGYSGAFIKNAALMGIDLTKLDIAAISHGHNDHTWGLNHLIQFYSSRRVSQKPLLLAHPEATVRKRSKDSEIGMLLGKDILRAFFDLKLSRKAEKITEKLLWLGEIPRKIEASRSLGTRVLREREEEDFLLDDSALVFDGEDGLVIITGCSHSGICNIVDYALTLTGKNKIADIIGGFHLLKEEDENLRKTGEWLAARSPKAVHACHCTDFQAKMALAKFVPLKTVGVGLKLEYK